MKLQGKKIIDNHLSVSMVEKDTQLRTEVTELRTEVTKLRTELTELRTELRKENMKLRTKFTTEKMKLRKEFTTENMKLRTEGTELRTKLHDIRPDNKVRIYWYPHQVTHLRTNVHEYSYYYKDLVQKVTKFHNSSHSGEELGN